MLQVINEISRVLDTDTKSNKVFWEPSFSTNCSGNGGVTATD